MESNSFLYGIMGIGLALVNPECLHLKCIQIVTTKLDARILVLRT